MADPTKPLMGVFFDNNSTYRKSLELVIQVDFLLTYGDVRVFYALYVVGFKVTVRR